MAIWMLLKRDGEYGEQERGGINMPSGDRDG